MFHRRRADDGGNKKLKPSPSVDDAILCWVFSFFCGAGFFKCKNAVFFSFLTSVQCDMRSALMERITVRNEFFFCLTVEIEINHLGVFFFAYGKKIPVKTLH